MWLEETGSEDVTKRKKKRDTGKFGEVCAPMDTNFLAFMTLSPTSSTDLSIVWTAVATVFVAPISLLCSSRL